MTWKQECGAGAAATAGEAHVLLSAGPSSAASDQPPVLRPLRAVGEDSGAWAPVGSPDGVPGSCLEPIIPSKAAQLPQAFGGAAICLSDF